MIRDVRNGTYRQPNRTTVAAFLESYLNKRTDLAGQTLKRYRSLARNQIAPRIGAVPLRKVTFEILEDLYETLSREGGVAGGPLSSSSVRQCHKLLRRAFRKTVRKKWLAASPAAEAEQPKPHRVEVVALDRDGLVRLLAALEGICGLRRGEVLALRWADVAADYSRLTVNQSVEVADVERLSKAGERTVRRVVQSKDTKNEKSRSVVLAAVVADALRRHRALQAQRRLAIGPGYRADLDLVVADEDGEWWNPESFTPRFKKAAREAGFPTVSFHTLRHTAASVMMVLGIAPKVVQETLGHYSAAFTLDRYSHVAPTLQTEAAGLMDRAMREGSGHRQA